VGDRFQGKESFMCQKSPWNVLVLVVLSVGTMAVTPAVSSAEEVPFKASLTGNAHLSLTDDPSVLRNDETGVGTATHLGLFTWADIEFADFDEVPRGVAVVASFNMTAANGDQLFGTFTSTGYFADAQTLVIHGSYEFTGGTGRFTEATGSGDIDASAFLSPGLPFEGTLTGTIDY
jgi:hypothetical protein